MLLYMYAACDTRGDHGQDKQGKANRLEERQHSQCFFERSKSRHRRRADRLRQQCLQGQALKAVQRS